MKKLLLMILISSFSTTFVFAKTKKIKADAYRQSTKLLKMAANELIESIKTFEYPKWKDFPERKKILLNILPYENLVKLPGTDKIFKGGQLLSMDHEINPHLLLIYKPFYVTYAGTADSEFEEKLPEIKKMLLMEASLTWGFNENEAENFANDFLKIAKPEISTNPKGPCVNSGNIYDGCAVEGIILPSIPNVELTNFIEPYTGYYLTKLTLPKNFIGYLYLSGLNITSLNKYQVKVRFRFGREQQPIDIEASVGRAQGIIPSSDKEVLLLDMTTQPFNKVRLLFDLYDYTDYRNKDGIEDFLDQNGNVVGPLYSSSDSLNYNLYCRGLNLEDDPTFKDTSDNNLCDEMGEKCLYSYAKMVDKALIDREGGLQYAYNNPSSPQSDPTGLGYAEQNFGKILSKSLPDNDDNGNLKGVLNALSVGDNSNNLNYNDLVTLKDGSTFLYQGPFRSISPESWEIKGKALVYSSNATQQAFGLFQKSYLLDNPNSGFKSMMFPRAGRIVFRKDTEYWGSQDSLGIRSLQKMETGGPSLFMDGSNLRVKNYNVFTNEGISSCNVTATIDLITIDPATGKEVSLLKNPDRELKLQLTRSTLKPMTGGPEVLYQSLQNCSNNNECSSDQCCFSNRCWDRKLVSSCMETDKNEGNRATGEICKSDFDCASFCCQKDTGTCGVHLITQEETFYCAKAPGQTCVTKEFCRKENITECKIIKTGTDSSGKITCDLKCYNNPTFGDCRNGYCEAPSQPPAPDFDPKNPDCTNAEDPPLGVN